MNSLEEVKKPEIGEYYVAYIDILGYKEYLEKNQQDANVLLDSIHRSIANIVKNIEIHNRIFKEFIQIDLVFKFKIFSDNILIYCQRPDDIYLTKLAVMALIEMLCALQRNLICQYGLFVRGGVVSGKFAANEYFVFGPALIAAVKAEEEIAKTPRIVIDGSVVEELSNALEKLPASLENIFQYTSESINSIFQTSKPQELHYRIKTATEFFAKILNFSYPAIIYDKNTVSEACNSLTDVRNLSSKLINISPNLLDSMFNSLRENYPVIASLIINIKSGIINYDKFRYENIISRDDDGIHYVNYLNLPKYCQLPIFNNVKMETLEKTFEGFPEVISDIKLHLDENTFKDIIIKHKKYIAANINQHKKNKKILDKYLWTLRMHNKICLENNFTESVVIISYSVDQDSSLPILNVE